MSLDRIFHAQSVAVIGASRDENKRGYQAIKTLLEHKYEGRIYPVNRREDMILGLRCYRNVLQIEGPVDLAFISTPAETMPEILEDCGEKCIPGAVVIAGGFGEVGKEGQKLEKKIVEIARARDIRLIGPNTSGMINVASNLNLVGIDEIPRGSIALLTQSGNIALHLIIEAKLKSLRGFSYYVGVGNEADLQFHEYLEFFRDDPDTNVILIYVEGMHDGRKFLQEAYKTTASKPIVLLKSGRSATGSKSAGSHTGSLAGISEVSRTAYSLAGIITVENADELFPAAETLSSLPPIFNNQIAILADGGGHATIAADLLTDLGVKIPPLRDKTQRQLRDILLPNSSVRNPIDVAGATDTDPALFADCAKVLLEDDHVGGLLIVGLFGGYGIRFAERLRFIEEDGAHRMGKLVRKIGKPIILHSLYNFAKPHTLELMRYYGIPVYDSLDIACKCVAVLSQHGRNIRSPDPKASFVFNLGAKARKGGRTLIEKAYGEKRKVLLEHEAKELLRMHGAQIATDGLAATADEAVTIAKKLKGTVALKICSPQILHKSDAHGVELNIKSDDERVVRAAYKKIIKNATSYNNKADIRGCVVCPMADEGLEIIIGTKIDDQFGPVIMFGIGGVLVEVLKDVAFRVLPISSRAPASMMKELRSSRLLEGFRGNKPVDKKALSKLMITVSEIIEAYPEIQEMDVNPVMAYPEGYAIVDARIILKKNNRRSIT
jgi:acetyltransferase